MMFSDLSYSAQNLTDSGINLDWFVMLMELLGGLALFLYGMEKMIKGLLVIAGDQMKSMLAKLTTNRVMGALTGAGVTAVIQSSSVTSVLTVGFVSAGLMTASQAAGVVMGANLGTTVTAQIVAFKVTNFALLLIAVGFSIQFLAKLRKKVAIGELLMGFGLIFFGMNLMGEGMAPLRDYEPFLTLIRELQNPFWGIFIGMVFTALIQSSSATIAIVIVMASNGFLTLPAGIALAMGANIGTTITALLATIGKSREALRTALIHVQFNLLAVLIWLPFIPELSQLSIWISAHDYADNEVMMLLAENTPREIANANTLFNLISLVVFLPAIPLFLWVVNKLVPVLAEEKGGGEFKAEFLDESLLSDPSLAMKAVKLELEHYQKPLDLFYKRSLAQIASPNMDKLSREDLMIRRLRAYQEKILSYLGRAGQVEMSAEEQHEHFKLMNVLNNLESMLESMQSNILSVAHEMIEEDIKPSETMQNLVGQLSSEVGRAMDNALLSIYKQDSEAALEVIAIKPTIDHLIQEALAHQIRHFTPNEMRLKVFRYEMQFVDGLKQLHTLSKRIARQQLSEISKESGSDSSSKVIS
ncbi:Na/Pi cotransporter family protein [Thiomicrorhabdus sp. zzn3]|uniref:Na/Pi cotransporter family protein n=1 Tax=Thiomicrorhabdus sp. zzn3 TaxID=3039775 RepID=UPI0024365B3A|nr:Na/Pi cotransporter family protein [Thiomicrorhabdus sp. zzn3]MDG6778779.1 Na/Pi cotransporter family protein [Thiomicrorhabdus sp. zzn3]